MVINHLLNGMILQVIAIPSLGLGRTSRSRDVPSEALWRWFGSREDQDHCTFAWEKYLFWWFSGWGWWWLGGLGLMRLMMLMMNVFWLCSILFVCGFVCDIWNFGTFTQNCSIASLFRLDLSVSCRFLGLIRKGSCSVDVFWLPFGCVYPVEFPRSHCIPPTALMASGKGGEERHSMLGGRTLVKMLFPKSAMLKMRYD